MHILWLRLRSAILFLLTFAVVGTAGAAEQGGAKDASAEIPVHPLFSSSFLIGVGGFYADANTNARYDSSAGIGTNIDFEQALGLDDNATVALVNFRWRFAKRWTLSGEYFDLRRDGSKVLQEDISWGETIYPAGSRANSEFNVRDIRLMADYSFFKRPDKEVGVGLGFHVMELEAAIETTTIAREQADVLAPLPVLSLHGNFALTDTWAVAARFDWLSVNYQEYSGNLRAFGIDALYQPFRNLGFGFGYRTLSFDIEIDGDDWKGKADMSFSGPAIQVYATF